MHFVITNRKRQWVSQKRKQIYAVLLSTWEQAHDLAEKMSSRFYISSLLIFVSHFRRYRVERQFIESVVGLFQNSMLPLIMLNHLQVQIFMFSSIAKLLLFLHANQSLFIFLICNIFSSFNPKFYSFTSCMFLNISNKVI